MSAQRITTRTVSAARRSGSAVPSRNRRHPQASGLEDVTYHHLDDRTADRPPGPPSEALRHDDQRATAHRAERRKVEVIRMAVRHDDHVNGTDGVRIGDGAVTFEWAEAAAQKRVGENADAVQLEQNSRVADELDADGRPTRAGWISRSGSGPWPVHASRRPDRPLARGLAGASMDAAAASRRRRGPHPPWSR